MHRTLPTTDKAARLSLCRRLMDQVYGPGVLASVPEARRNGNLNAVMGSSSIVPRFRNIDTKSDKFLRGYALNTTAATGAVAARNFAAYGAELQRKMAASRAAV